MECKRCGIRMITDEVAGKVASRPRPLFLLYECPICGRCVAGPQVKHPTRAERVSRRVRGLVIP